MRLDISAGVSEREKKKTPTGDKCRPDKKKNSRESFRVCKLLWRLLTGKDHREWEFPPPFSDTICKAATGSSRGEQEVLSAFQVIEIPVGQQTLLRLEKVKYNTINILR